MEVTNDRARRLEAALDAEAPPVGSSPSKDCERRVRYPSDEALRELHERLPSIDTSFLAPAHKPAHEVTGTSGVRRRASESEILQGRLDDFRDRFSGPYHVDGQSVRARPMFRKNTPGAYNRDLLQRNCGSPISIPRTCGPATSSTSITRSAPKGRSVTT